MNKKKLIIFAGIGLVVVLLAVGGWMFLSGGDKADVPPEQAPGTTKPQVDVGGPALYVDLPEPFIFNVSGSNRDRVAQISVQLMVRGDANYQVANNNIPLIQSQILSTFSSATVEELRATDGLTTLRDKATKAVQDAMQKVAGRPVVERVLFTGFVMQ
ncbi:hypothetical protein VST7929_02008 [Vibrio stylophorae]|uniref:Flagellar protein FliL n=1 Tax=Vibrio stylophorae TaxID=659351 RepID=A0ABM8ZUV6_9VIBR|nr:flagellar basal body-associated protein FliL [Vibrio stylophorae]CAH0534107.1 hypothetical protein VST7929_02008 [Vibrio stylophorae]